MLREISIKQMKRHWRVEENLICDKNLCIVVHKIRMLKNQSLESLAQEIGISRMTLYRIYRGKFPVFHPSVIEICKIVGITTDDLLWMCEITTFILHNRLYHSYEEFNMCLALTISVVRESTGLTQEDVASILGTWQTRYNRIESVQIKLLNPCAWKILQKTNLYKNQLLP